MKVTVTPEDLNLPWVCEEGIKAFRHYVGNVYSVDDYTLEHQIDLIRGPLRIYWGWAVRWKILPSWPMTGVDLKKADLSGADFRGMNLSGADLSGADLRKADLRWANLRGADLRAADLYCAALFEADLTETDLKGANLKGTKLDVASLHYKWVCVGGAY